MLEISREFHIKRTYIHTHTHKFIKINLHKSEYFTINPRKPARMEKLRHSEYYGGKSQKNQLETTKNIVEPKNNSEFLKEKI